MKPIQESVFDALASVRRGDDMQRIGLELLNAMEAQFEARLGAMPSFDQRMQDDCTRKGKTSLLYQVPNGNSWLFVSKSEPEPLTAFLKAMLDVMMTRGFVGTDGPVTIRRLSGGLIVPGREVYWCVKDLTTGEIYADGYCANEDAARVLISEAILAKGA